LGVTDPGHVVCFKSISPQRLKNKYYYWTGQNNVQTLPSKSKNVYNHYNLPQKLKRKLMM